MVAFCYFYLLLFHCMCSCMFACYARKQLQLLFMYLLNFLQWFGGKNESKNVGNLQRERIKNRGEFWVCLVGFAGKIWLKLMINNSLNNFELFKPQKLMIRGENMSLNSFTSNLPFILHNICVESDHTLYCFNVKVVIYCDIYQSVWKLILVSLLTVSNSVQTSKNHA